MWTKKYFCWTDDIAIVYGASRAAIYDFSTGKVFSLNRSARRILELIEMKQPVPTMDTQAQTFLSHLVQLGLGEYKNTPSESRTSPEVSPSVPLRFLSLELTEACNLSCTHCYANSGPHKSSAWAGAASALEHEIPLHPRPPQPQAHAPSFPRMQETDWIRVIRDAAELGCRRIQFIGGEPLLYRPLLTLIDTAVEAGYEFIELFTNGTLLTEERTQALAERGVHVAVSVHGSRAEIHDPIANQEGAFDKMSRGLHMLQKHQVPTRAATSVFQENQDDVENIIHWLQSIGVSDATHDIVRAIGRGRNVKQLPTNEQVLKSKWLFEPDFVTSRESYLRSRFWNSCWAGQLSITSQGHVAPCIMGREQVLGNVHEEALEEILESPRLRQFWGLTKDQVDVCRDCEYRYACHDCRPLALGETGDLHAKYPRCTYNPCTGDWQSIHQVLHLATQNQSDEAAADEQRAGSESADSEAYQDSIPEILLVTNTLTSAQQLHQRLSCDPQG